MAGMEKPQLERRDKIAAGIVLGALAGVAVYAKKEGRLGHARHYPGGSYIIDVIKSSKEKSIRISGVITNLNPLKITVDKATHSDEELDEVEDVFNNGAASE